MGTTRIVTISEKTFDQKREDANYQGGLTPDTRYKIVTASGSESYAYTVDGIGCYYYDTVEELREDVG